MMIIYWTSPLTHAMITVYLGVEVQSSPCKYVVLYPVIIQTYMHAQHIYWVLTSHTLVHQVCNIIVLWTIINKRTIHREVCMQTQSICCGNSIKSESDDIGITKQSI